MKKLGSKGMKWLKILHIVSVALWFGGVASLLALRLGLDLSSYDEVNATYHSMRVIDELLIRNGAQGIILSSLLYSILTNWGFVRHRWVSVKWLVFIGQLVLGIAFLNRWVGTNVALLETDKAAALSNAVFLQNHANIHIGILTQIVLIILLTIISVFKPWKGRSVTS